MGAVIKRYFLLEKELNDSVVALDKGTLKLVGHRQKMVLSNCGARGGGSYSLQKLCI